MNDSMVADIGQAPGGRMLSEEINDTFKFGVSTARVQLSRQDSSRATWVGGGVLSQAGKENMLGKV